jgi:hypothetical protein
MNSDKKLNGFNNGRDTTDGIGGRPGFCKETFELSAKEPELDFSTNPIDAGCLIRTYSGKYVNPFNIREEDICIEDIAHALSLLCRFGGHCKKFYSVAEHSLLVSEILMGGEFAFEGLMHDASEAYLVDMPSPIKELMPQYREIEHNLMLVIAKKYGFNWPVSQKVKTADRLSLEWEWINNVVNDNVIVLSQEKVKETFIKRFYELAKIKV